MLKSFNNEASTNKALYFPKIYILAMTHLFKISFEKCFNETLYLNINKSQTKYKFN